MSNYKVVETRKKMSTWSAFLIVMFNKKPSASHDTIKLDLSQKQSVPDGQSMQKVHQLKILSWDGPKTVTRAEERKSHK